MPTTALAAPAPGAPGTVEQALPADKSGFGTSTTGGSKVWFTVQKEGGLGELFAPTIDAPSARALEFVVADRRGHARRASDADHVTTTLIDSHSLTYRQTFTVRRDWRLTATYVTDPSLATVRIDLRFAALDGGRHKVYAIYDPSLSNTRNDDSRPYPGRRTRRDGRRDEGGERARRLTRPGGHVERVPRHQRRLDGPACGRTSRPALHVGGFWQPRADRRDGAHGAARP